jgi:hypothetical protein
MDSQVEKMQTCLRKTEAPDLEENSEEERPYRSSGKSLKKIK